MSLYARLSSAGPSGFGYASTAEDVTQGLDLTGKTILITGCNSGLGHEAMRVLAMRGATVLGTARDQAKAAAACAAVGGKTVPFACELAEPASVRACVAAVKAGGYRLDAIIANAGIMALPKLEQVFGYEKQFLTNHIGHFLLVTGLLDTLTEDGRVVMLSSAAHKMAPKGGIEFDNLSGEKGYRDWTQYGQSKMANLLFAKALSRQFAGSRKVAVAVHPGVIQTNLGRHMNPVAQFFFGLTDKIALKSIAQGAATEVFAAVHPGAAGLNGAYLADCNVAKPRGDANDEAIASQLWRVSEEIALAVSKRPG